MENDIEKIIVDWLKSGDENATNLAYEICDYVKNNNQEDYVEVKRNYKYKGMDCYQEWTKVSRFLANGLQGVDVREIISDK